MDIMTQVTDFLNYIQRKNIKLTKALKKSQTHYHFDFVILTRINQFWNILCHKLQLLL